MTLAGALTRHRAGIALAVMLLLVAGALSLRALPRGLYPELAFPRVVVVATVPDATAEIILLNVTRPLEEALTPLLGVRRVRSRTIRGAVEIALQYDPDSDMQAALQQVQAKLAEVRADLPPDVTVAAERLTPTSFPVLTVNVDGPLAPTALRDVALYQIRPALSRVSGVGPITVTAGEVREVEVEVDPARAEAAGLTVEEIAGKIGAANRVTVVGRLDHAYRRYVVTVEGRATAPAQLGALIVGGNAQRPIALRDVAVIREGQVDPRLLVRSPSGPAALVNVSRRIGGDVVSLDAALREAIERLRGEVPPGVRLTIVYEQASLIGAATGAVRDSLLVGAALSGLVMLLFLRDRRATLIAALSVPSSLLAACAVVWASHGSLNLMSLGGMAIAVGLVIDDAVVVVEAIRRELDAGRPPREAAEAGVGELAGPVLSSTITTVVVFAPLAMLSGVVGAFFAALSLALAAAVLLSLVIALTALPLLASRFLRPSSKAAREPLAATYDRLLGRSLRRGLLVVVAGVLVVVVGGFATTRVETGFIPEMDEGSFVLDYYTPSGTSLPEADALAGVIDAELRADADVETFSRRLGAELGPPAATDASRGDYIVRLKSRRARTIFEVMESLRGRIEKRAPGVRVEIIQLLQDMLGDLEGNPEPIEIKLFGDDESELRRQAKRVADAIADVPGLVDRYDGQVACSPERRLRLDPVAVGRLGLGTDTVASQLRAQLLGEQVTALPEGDRLLPVRVRWPDRARLDEHVLDRVRLRTPAGTLVPISVVGRVEDGCAPAELRRENLRLMVPVTARLEGTDLGSAVAAIEKKLANFDLPRGVSIEMGGQKLSQADAFRGLALALAAAVALVLLVLVFQFRGFVAPLAILTATPVALAGGVITLWASRVALNISSLLGAILLVGLVVKNGILLLHHAEVRREAGAPLEEAIAEAGRARLRPILMTTLCTLVGLVPLVLGLGAGAEMHRPLAVAVLGGLFVSTPATLLLVPPVYRWLSLRSERRSKKI